MTQPLHAYRQAVLSDVKRSRAAVSRINSTVHVLRLLPASYQHLATTFGNIVLLTMFARVPVQRCGNYFARAGLCFCSSRFLFLTMFSQSYKVERPQKYGSENKFCHQSNLHYRLTFPN